VQSLRSAYDAMTDESAFEIRPTFAAGDAIVLTVVGEVDMTTAPALAQALDGLPRTTSRVVVDLTGVTFLDSSGLSVLARAQKDLAANDTPLSVVAPPSSAVRRVIEITQLDGTLSLLESLDDAAV
jgi:anti-sigma B factor antagonist